jgi:hypothetical protein
MCVLQHVRSTSQRSHVPCLLLFGTRPRPPMYEAHPLTAPLHCPAAPQPESAPASAAASSSGAWGRLQGVCTAASTPQPEPNVEPVFDVFTLTDTVTPSMLIACKQQRLQQEAVHRLPAMQHSPASYGSGDKDPQCHTQMNSYTW